MSRFNIALLVLFGSLGSVICIQCEREGLDTDFELSYNDTDRPPVIEVVTPRRLYSVPFGASKPVRLRAKRTIPSAGDEAFKLLGGEEMEEKISVTTEPPKTDNAAENSTTPRGRPSEMLGLGGAEHVDLCFLVDVTGSMSPYIRAVRDSVFKIVDDLQNDNDTESSIGDIRVAFVGYRDHSDRVRFEVLDFTRDIEKFRNFVSKTQAQGGGDTPEDVHGGLNRAMRLEWGDRSRTRLIFHMADAPAHGCDMHDYHSDSYASDPHNLTFASLFTRMDEMEVDFFFANITSATDIMLERMREACNSTVNTIDIGIARSHHGHVGHDGAYSRLTGPTAPHSYAERVYSAVFGSVKSAVLKKMGAV